MNIISVTDEANGEKIFINPNYIIRFYQKSGATRIELHTNNSIGAFYIKESAEWLFEHINNIG